MFADLKAEIYKRQLSNSENFDKSVLTYSVAALGLSLGFLKDFIPITKAVSPWMLHASWALFVLAIVLTMASFLVSQAGLKKQLRLAERYYIESDKKALTEINNFSQLTEATNFTSGAFFVVGLILTTLFVATNLEQAAIVNEAKDQQVPLGAVIPDIRRMPQPDVRRGAPIPDIQPLPPAPAPVPAPPPPAPAPSPGSSGGQR